jgi:cytochrome d ubiquinol oxidase subunit I
MDVVWLARLQFSLTIMFHFLFPPITIGLAFLILLLETARWRTAREVYRRASDFWLGLFTVTFVVGVATGIVMEFEFGTNWATYSRFVGDIFGAPLAAEAIFAFFLESGFLGLLIFGRKRISSFVRWFASLMVALGTTLSAFWIIVANSWMQTPAGFRLANGRAEMTDFLAVVFNPSTLPRFTHTVAAAWTMGAFLMAGIAAWYYLKGRGSDVARVSLKLGTVMAVVACVLNFTTGDHHAKQVARTQEAKFAAMEGLFTTQRGAPFTIFALPPTQSGRRPGPELAVPGLTSFLAFGDFQALVRGLEDFPRRDWPPVAITFLSFHHMVILGGLMLLVALLGLVLLWRGRLERARWWQHLAFWSIPLPMIAIQLGWVTAEVGRQPWIVYGLMRTRDVVSKVVGAPQILFSIVLFGAIYAVLGVLWLYLLRREIIHGPALAGTEAEVRHAAA